MKFELRTDFIELQQLLKACGLVDTGAEAKMMIAEGGILVNGDEESRRGRKLRAGDVVHLPDGHEIRVG